MSNTIEELENDFWEAPASDSSALVKQCYFLRKKPLTDFTPEDYRLLLNQDIGLEVIVPGVIAILQEQPFIAGDYYEGDLFNALMTIDAGYWQQHPDLKHEVLHLFEMNAPLLGELDLSSAIVTKLWQSYKQLQGLL